ncbi:hypothetical protein BKA93DRAFT_749226 [Sparassis latifolia]
MASKLRMSIGDILHRGVVYSLVGISIWGVAMMGFVHRDTLQKGKGKHIFASCTVSFFLQMQDLLGLIYIRTHKALALQEATASAQKAQQDEASERALAEAAQSAFRGQNKSS